MVTRTPLHLELIQTNKNSAMKKFGDFRVGTWTSINKTNLDVTNPTPQQAFVKKMTEEITNKS